MTEKGCVCV